MWEGIGNSLSNLISIWWEHPKIVDKLNMFRRVRVDSFQNLLVLTVYRNCLSPWSKDWDMSTLNLNRGIPQCCERSLWNKHLLPEMKGKSKI